MQPAAPPALPRAPCPGALSTAPSSAQCQASTLVAATLPTPHLPAPPPPAPTHAPPQPVELQRATEDIAARPDQANPISPRAYAEPLPGACANGACAAAGKPAAPAAPAGPKGAGAAACTVAAAAPGPAGCEAEGKVAHPSLLNPRVLATTYAVRGEIYLKAEELRKAGRDIIFTNSEGWEGVKRGGCVGWVGAGGGRKAGRGITDTISESAAA